MVVKLAHFALVWGKNVSDVGVTKEYFVWVLCHLHYLGYFGKHPTSRSREVNFPLSAALVGSHLEDRDQYQTRGSPAESHLEDERVG